MLEHLILFVLSSLLCLDDCPKFKSSILPHSVLEICYFYLSQRSVATYSPVSVLSPTLFVSVFSLLPSLFLSSLLSFSPLSLSFPFSSSSVPLSLSPHASPLHHWSWGWNQKLYPVVSHSSFLSSVLCGTVNELGFHVFTFSRDVYFFIWLWVAV